MRKHNENRWLLLASTILYWFPLLLISFLPRRPAFGIASHVGRLKYRRWRSRIKLQRANMELRLGASPEQVEGWLERSFELATYEDLECCFYPRMTKENIGGFIEIRGLENLTSALGRGKGVILYSGHVRGHFTFFVALGLLGYRLNLISSPGRSGRNLIESWFYGRRRTTLMEEKLGYRILLMQPPNFGIAVQAANALKRNEGIIIEVDLPLTRQNAEVCFLNGRARFPYGPALLAQVTGAPLLNFYLYRTDKRLPQIAEIGPPFYVSNDLAGAIQHCATQIGDKIFQYPASWNTWLFSKWNLWEGLE